jgi:superfamily I DNA and/or RNA helicase
MGEFRELKISPYSVPRPWDGSIPYLGVFVNLNFNLPQDHFLVGLGKYLEEEVDLISEENEKLENSPRRVKIMNGELLEELKIVDLLHNYLALDISKVESNIKLNSAVRVKNLRTNEIRSGNVAYDDGSIMVVETYMDAEKEDKIELVNDFTAFDYWRKNTWIDHFFRFLRTQVNVEWVESKLTGNSERLGFEIEPIHSMGSLDPSQVIAFNKCISNEPITLVQGPPGTGKTTFAAYLSDHLVKIGFSVMVTAFTHEAVNNVLEKILEIGGKVQKIGKPNRSTEKLNEFSALRFHEGEAEGYVLGMTIHELLKNHKKYDFILVDEASQMDIVSGVHFLASSKKTIFIGDHMQLPNISKIQNSEFSLSIFDLLRQRYQPVSLLITYRFNQGICDYISSNFYDGKLECAGHMKSNFLQVPNGFVIQGLNVLCPKSLKQPLIFIHTEEEVEFLINREHANLVADLIQDFLFLNVPKTEIGVIAPNNMQVNFIKKVLSAREIGWTGIRIETVNKFQGLQKEVIVYSSVVTKIGSKHAKYDFFFDSRRFNVAISRAKKMAIVLGNRDLFSTSSELLSEGHRIANFLNYAYIKKELR